MRHLLNPKATRQLFKNIFQSHQAQFKTNKDTMTEEERIHLEELRIITEDAIKNGFKVTKLSKNKKSSIKFKSKKKSTSSSIKILQCNKKKKLSKKLLLPTYVVEDNKTPHDIKRVSSWNIDEDN